MLPVLSVGVLGLVHGIVNRVVAMALFDIVVVVCLLVFTEAKRMDMFLILAV